MATNYITASTDRAQDFIGINAPIGICFVYKPRSLEAYNVFTIPRSSKRSFSKSRLQAPTSVGFIE